MAAREFYSGAKEDSLTQADSLLNAYYLLLDGSETGELVNIMSDFPAFPVGDSSSTYAEQMDSLAAYQALQGYFSSRVRGFSPANSVQAMDHNFIDLAQLIGSRKSSIFEDIFELQMDTVADEEQAVLFDSLYIQLEIIPSAIKADLVELANECPYEKGPAVLWARAAFPDSTFINACEIIEERVSLRLAGTQYEQTNRVTALVKIYPNPAKDRFMVELPSGTEAGQIEIFDLQGRVVFTQTLTSSVSQISFESFAGTMYIYSVRTDNGLVEHGRIFFQKE